MKSSVMAVAVVVVPAVLSVAPMAHADTGALTGLTTGVSFDMTTVLAAAAIVLGGTASIWAIRKVIGMFQGR